MGNLSVKDIGQLSGGQKTSIGDNNLETARRSLLRSKGFVWMATSSTAAYFMSHAGCFMLQMTLCKKCFCSLNLKLLRSCFLLGQYLELATLGRWWADLPKEEWPPGADEEIMRDFEGTHGDRRQELVFIGQFSDDGGMYTWNNNCFINAYVLHMNLFV